MSVLHITYVPPDPNPPTVGKVRFYGLERGYMPIETPPSGKPQWYKPTEHDLANLKTRQQEHEREMSAGIIGTHVEKFPRIKVGETEIVESERATIIKKWYHAAGYDVTARKASWAGINKYLVTRLK